jgi:hypothetical protein
MKKEHINELKLNKIKNPCISCLYLHGKIDSEPCLNCNKNNGNVDNYKEKL